MEKRMSLPRPRCRALLCLVAAALLLSGCSVRPTVEDNAAAYARLADSYLDKAQEVLQQGLDKTGDEQLRQRLQALQALRDGAGEGLSIPETATRPDSSAMDRPGRFGDTGASDAVPQVADPASSSASSSSTPPAGAVQEDSYFAQLYRPLTTFPDEERQLVNDIMDMVMESDTDGLFSLEMPEDFYCYTFWNGYKCAVESWGSGYSIEVRPEEGHGAYYEMRYSTTDLGVASSDTAILWMATCDCLDWQWNGEMRQRMERYDIVTYSDGATSTLMRSLEMTGNLYKGLRNGGFVRSGTVYSVDETAPSNNWQATQRSEFTYMDGVLVDQRDYQDEVLLYAWDTADKQQNAGSCYGISDQAYALEDADMLYW